MREQIKINNYIMAIVTSVKTIFFESFARSQTIEMDGFDNEFYGDFIMQ